MPLLCQLLLTPPQAAPPPGVQECSQCGTCGSDWCRILIEDPEVRSKVMWEGMQLVEPWENEEVSDDIFTINPTFLPRDRLSAAQQSVRALLPTAAVHRPVRVCTWLPEPATKCCQLVRMSTSLPIMGWLNICLSRLMLSGCVPLWLSDMLTNALQSQQCCGSSLLNIASSAACLAALLTTCTRWCVSSALSVMLRI